MSIPKVTTGLLPLPTRASDDCFDKVKAAVHFALDCLVMVWFVLEHCLYRVFSNKTSGNYAFKGREICKTHNFAKFSELWKYVQLRRNPLPLSDWTKTYAIEHGFQANLTHLSTNPHTDGFCQGGIIAFFKKWFETGNIHEVAAYFKGGVPIEGALYQKIYNALFTHVYYPTFVERIKKYIGHYSDTSTYSSEERLILDGIKVYLDEGNRPETEGMAEWVRDWGVKNREILIGGEYYASLRKAEQSYSNKKINERDHFLALFPLVNLRAAPLYYDASLKEVMQDIKHLNPGVYNFVFPTPEGRHSIGFIIQESGFSYFYEANSAIAYVPREEVEETVWRLLKKSSGITPNSSLSSGFDLLEVKEATP